MLAKFPINCIFFFFFMKTLGTRGPRNTNAVILYL